MDIVINVNPAAADFHLSEEASDLLWDRRPLYPADLSAWPSYCGDAYELAEDFAERTEWRDHPDLVNVVRELGTEAGSMGSILRVGTIPDDVDWVLVVNSKTGWEHIAEKHRTWRYSVRDCHRFVPLPELVTDRSRVGHKRRANPAGLTLVKEDTQ